MKMKKINNIINEKENLNCNNGILENNYNNEKNNLIKNLGDQ